MKNRILFIVVLSVLCVAISLFTAGMYAIALDLPHGQAVWASVAMLAIPALFIASFAAANTGRPFNRLLYTEVNVLAGIGYYLFLGAVGISALFAITVLAGHAFAPGVGYALITLSLCAALTGLWQARRIRVVRHTVAIESLPEAWEGATAVLVSDTHFGLVNSKRFSTMVIDRIAAIAPDMVFHAGDLYDGPPTDTNAIAHSWKALTEKIPVFYTPGNHEHYGDFKGFIRSARDAGMTVLIDEKITHDGVTIAGIDYREEGGSASSEAIAALSLPRSHPTILLNHPPNAHEAASREGVALMLSGHTHNGQFWPNNYLVRARYKQFSYGMGSYKNMTTITTSGVGTFGPPLRFLNPPELVHITFTAKTGK